jgi:hypothetical protein
MQKHQSWGFTRTVANLQVHPSTQMDELTKEQIFARIIAESHRRLPTSISENWTLSYPIREVSEFSRTRLGKIFRVGLTNKIGAQSRAKLFVAQRATLCAPLVHIYLAKLNELL